MARRRPSPPRELFLSHSDRDRAFVRKLVNVLRANDLPVWYSQTHIVGADQWHDEIGRALERCDWFLIVLSPHSAKSIWVKRELMFALQAKRLENRIVPILYRSCNYRSLSWTLPSFQIVDFTRDFEMACRNLLRVWRKRYRAPDAE